MFSIIRLLVVYCYSLIFSACTPTFLSNLHSVFYHTKTLVPTESLAQAEVFDIAPDKEVIPCKACAKGFFYIYTRVDHTRYYLSAHEKVSQSLVFFSQDPTHRLCFKSSRVSWNSPLRLQTQEKLFLSVMQNGYIALIKDPKQTILLKEFDEDGIVESTSVSATQFRLFSPDISNLCMLHQLAITHPECQATYDRGYRLNLSDVAGTNITESLAWYPGDDFVYLPPLLEADSAKKIIFNPEGTTIFFE